MKGKKSSGRGDFEDTQSIPIDFGTLLSEDVSSSGSFYVNEVQTSSLGKLLQALPIPVLLIDKDQRIIFVNQACERISPTFEKMLGTGFSKLVPDRDAAREIHLLAKEVFSSRKPRVHQALMGIEGPTIWGRIYFRPLRVAKERLVLLLIEDLSLEKRQLAVSQKHREELIHEVTERKRAETALRESETLLRSILSTSPVGIGLADGRTMRWANEAWMEMFGFENEREFVGHSARIVYPSDAEYKRVGEALYESLQTGQVTSVDAMLRRKDGSVFDGHIRMKALAKPGLPMATVAAISDISDRKRAEEALRQSEKRFRAIFERAEDYIFLKDRSLRYTDVNPAAERLLGRPASEIIGSTYDDLFSKEDAAYLRDVDTRVLRGETIQEEHTVKISGVAVTLLETRVPLRDDTGEIAGIFAIARDITDRKRTEVSAEPTKEYPSAAMQATLKSALLAAKRNATILLTGESGSGKDYLAQYIHSHSDRANGPYFAVNCAAIVPQLAESELFGHERGAFTGAVGRKRGLLELAEGGTLLLNEIGELSLSLQAKLLTFLDTRRFTRVGGEKEVTVNARLIAATNRDLEQEVAAKRFRQDLFYRINVISIGVPPLRVRSEDIPVLVQEIISRLRGELHISETPAITSSALNALRRYAWPGNVRELRNVLERSLILSHGKKLSLETLGLHEVPDLLPKDKKTSFGVSFPSHRSLNEITQDLKRFLVNEALRRSGGSRQGAAALLGISRYSLKHYMKTLGFDEE
jgi:PAS domain S-box-containing protein